MKDELMRRISDAMDAPGEDAALTALLEGDAEAAAYATDLRRVDEALGMLAGPGRYDAESFDVSGVDWEAMAGAIDAQLESDAAFADIGDPTAPPVFDDAFVSPPSAEASGASRVAGEPAVEPVLVTSASAPAPVVDLAARRRQRTFWIASVGGLAAAAAVALGLTAGMSLEDDLAPAAESAAVAADAPLPAAPAATQAAFPADEEEEDVSLSYRGQAADTMATETLAEADPMPFAAEVQPAAPAEAPGPMAAAPARRPRRARARPMARTSGVLAGSIQDGWASGGAPAPPPAPAPGATGVAPDERAAQAALASVNAQVRQCMGTVREVARIRVQADASGRIQHVDVGAPFTGAAAACMTRAVQRVRLPAASAGYSIGHAYRPLPVAGTGRGGTAVGAANRARRAAPAPTSAMSDDF